MKRKLYPTLREPMTTVGFNLQNSVLDCVNNLADRQGQTRSEMVRNLVIESLRAQGHVATVEEAEAERRAAREAA